MKFLFYCLSQAAYLVQVIIEVCSMYTGPDLSAEQHALLQKFREPLRRARSLFWIRWQLITDYRADDPATSKVINALERFWGFPCGFNTLAVPNFDTLALSYDAMTQLLVPISHLPRWVVGYLNSAPIKEKDQRNGGHPFYAVLLTNGVVVFTPNSGHSLSFLLPYIVAVVKLDFQNETEQPPNNLDCQFRSHWYFSQAAARFLRGDFSKVLAVWDRSGDHGIPELPETAFVRTDNFRNVKTALTQRHAEEVLGLRDGDVVEIHINGARICNAVYGRNVHHVQLEPALSLKAGSGIVQAAPGETPDVYLDMFVVGAEAYTALNRPTQSDVVTIVKVHSQEHHRSENAVAV